MTERTVTEQTVLADRGYQPYRGPRLGPSGAMRAITGDGIRRILGLRRKARRKVLPWLMISLMAGTMFIFLMIVWAQGLTEFDLLDRPYTGFLGAIALYGLILTSFAAPELLIPDRTSGVLNVYFSRPLTVNRYLTAKGGALAAVILGFWTAPLLIFHLGLAFLSEEGFLAYLGGNLAALWRIPLASLAYLAAYGTVALLCAALLRRVGAATGVCIAVFFTFNIAVNIAATFSETTARWLSLLAFEQHALHLRDWIFGYGGTDLMQRLGFDPWVSLLVMFVLASITGYLIKFTYRKPA